MANDFILDMINAQIHSLNIQINDEQKKLSTFFSSDSDLFKSQKYVEYKINFARDINKLRRKYIKKLIKLRTEFN